VFFDKAQLYTQGVLVSHRCNIEQICDNLLEPNYFQMQHFISDSNWSYRDAIDIAAKQTSSSLRKVKLTGFLIDETGTEKKGDKSVGVGHQYCGNVGKTAKGTLRGLYHFKKVYIWNKQENQIEQRLLIIRRMKTKSGMELKYSFTNADLIQYTPKALAYMQAQRFFIEHCIKEAKYILGMDQFQTRKWLAWYHQVALNIMIMCFMLKEKLLNFKELQLLSARDIKDWLCFNMTKELTEYDTTIV